jgi:hypothetical protein
MKTHLFSLAFFVVILSVALAGCSDEDADLERNEELDTARLAEMRQEILDYVGTPTCEGESSCRSMGMGSKPCGGPWGYLIYSADNVDSLELVTLVSAYNDYNEDLNLKYGWMSDCSVPTPPVLTCQDGQCVDAAKEQ